VSVDDNLTPPDASDEPSDEAPGAGAASPSTEGLPGGTGRTAEEKLIDDVTTSLVEELVAVFGASIGQGNEDLQNEESLAIVRENLRDQIGALVNALGADEFLKLFNLKSTDSDAAANAARDLASMVRTMLDANGGAEFYEVLFDTEDAEIVAMLPDDFDDDGEAD
jgi:hypothetical protein